MSGSDGLWELHGFPELIVSADEAFMVEVQRAYANWKDVCKVSPQRDAAPVDAGGDRYTAVVPGAYYLDESSGMQQLVCDYVIEPGPWGKPGRVVYVDSGFVPA